MKNNNIIKNVKWFLEWQMKNVKWFLVKPLVTNKIVKEYSRLCVQSLVWGLILFIITMNVLFFFQIDYNIITIETKVTLSDFINISIALIITLLIPFFFSRILDKHKSSKELLLYEITRYLKVVESTSLYIVEYNESQGIQIWKDSLNCYIIDLWNHYNLILKFFQFKSWIDLSDLTTKHMQFRGVVTDTIGLESFSFSSKYKTDVIIAKWQVIAELEKIKFEML